MVKKKGETEYKTVKTSEFAASGWNGVTFAAEGNVTNVKIKALSTLGNPANTYASLAEIRVLKEIKEEEIKPDKTELKKLVQLAESVKAKEKNKDTKVLEEKIKAAKAVLGNEAASWFDIALAKANLKKAEPKNTEEVDVPDDKTAQGTADTAKDDVSKTAKTLKKDKRILKALNEVKAETKVLKALQKETSKKINIVKQLKDYRKTVNNDKKYLSIKKKLESAISFLEKNKITTTNSLLKKLASLNKQLKKLQASNKNVKNEAKIKKLQKEMANIKLVISSLEGAKKFFEK